MLTAQNPLQLHPTQLCSRRPDRPHLCRVDRTSATMEAAEPPCPREHVTGNGVDLWTLAGNDSSQKHDSHLPMTLRKLLHLDTERTRRGLPIERWRRGIYALLIAKPKAGLVQVFKPKKR